jgi:glutaminyl-tRNA synthetase
LEFEDHRLLYDWFLDQLSIYHPRQIEFARLNLSYTITSTRKLKKLVEGGYVRGWDDPRLPNLASLRRRGFSPEAIKQFVHDIGIAKTDSVIAIDKLEHYLREDLNLRARRFMAVLKPAKLVIDNYPDDKVEEIEAINNPEDSSAGTRKVPFSKILYIEQDDFRENPPPKYFRLAPGREIRLRYAYFIKCIDIKKDTAGKIEEIHCLYDPKTKGGDAPDGRKVKSTIHWVSADQAIKAEVRLYDRLFVESDPDNTSEAKTFMDLVNHNSLEVINNAVLEPGLANARIGEYLQFERLGYFCLDPDSSPERQIFNRAVTLKDTWAKIEKKR